MRHLARERLGGLERRRRWSEAGVVIRVEARSLQVDRALDPNRTRTSVGGLPDRVLDLLLHGRDVVEHHSVFRDLVHERQRVEPLKRELPWPRDLGLRDLRLPGDDHHWRRVHIGANDAGKRVQRTRTRGHVGHADAVVVPAVGVGRHHRGLFVVARDPLLLTVHEHRIGKMHDHATGDHEHGLTAGAVERIGQVVCDAHLHRPTLLRMVLAMCSSISSVMPG